MTQKTRIKISILIVIIGLMGFSDWSFAEDENKVTFLGVGLDIVLSVLSWIWVFVANIAGTFLTNKWVYGEVFGWDVLLWKFRNIVKNFANFGLGFYLMYIIFRGLINQTKGEDVTKNLKDTILWLLIAGIGIQSSRFLTATVIDVSSITLVAAGSFPSQVLSESQYTQENLKKSLKDFLGTGGKNISLFPKDAKESNFLKTSVFEVDTSKLEGTGSDVEKLIDALMPNQDDISGPLYFIGYSFLKTNVITSLNTSSETTTKSAILNMLIQGGTSIVFSIEILMLCIIAMMRIVYLWMFIVLSPIVVLLKCLEKMGDKNLLNAEVVKPLKKQLSLKTFLVNTFKPTFIVLGLGIAVIFVSQMKGVIIDSAGKGIDIGGTVITSQINQTTNTNTDEGDRRYNSTIEFDLLKFTALNIGKTLLEVILSIIVVIMLYVIVSQAMKLGGGEDFVSKRISGITKSFENLVTETPFIPVPGYDNQGIPKKANISIGGLAGLPEKYSRNVRQKISNYSAKQEDAVMQMLGVSDDTQLSQEEKENIRYAGSNVEGLEKLKEKRAYIDTIKSEKGKGMILNPNAPDDFWIKQFTGWLNDVKIDKLKSGDIWRRMKKEWDSFGDNKSLEKLFNQRPDFVRAYATLFRLGDISLRSELMNKDISSQNDTSSGGGEESGESSSGTEAENSGTSTSGAENSGTPTSGAENTGTPAS